RLGSTPLLSESERQEHIGKLLRESKARSIARWQAAGVPRQMATEFSEDTTIGAPTAEMTPDTQKPVRILIAELGVGKSLVGERLHQAAITKSLADQSAPIPAWCKAEQAAGKLIEVVLGLASGLGVVTRQGAS